MHSFKSFLDDADNSFDSNSFPDDLFTLPPEENGEFGEELLSELNIRSVAPAIAIGYILKDHNKVKSLMQRVKSARNIEEKIIELSEVMLVQSRQNLVLSALVYAGMKKR